MGATAFAGTTSASHPQTLEVDVPPVINPKSKGRVPTTVLRDSSPTPADVLADPGFTGFKLGPRGTSVDENGADATSWQLRGNGDLKVIFDPRTANIWFDDDDGDHDSDGESEASLSAPEVAWGTDPVRVL